MPHPDSLSGMGTSRTTTPGSSGIHIIACSVPGLPRFAIRLPSKIRYSSVAPSGRDGSSGTASTTHSALPSFMLALPSLVPKVQHAAPLASRRKLTYRLTYYVSPTRHRLSILRPVGDGGC